MTTPKNININIKNMNINNKNQNKHKQVKYHHLLTIKGEQTNKKKTEKDRK